MRERMGVPADIQIPDLPEDFTPTTSDFSPDPELLALGHSHLPPSCLDSTPASAPGHEPCSPRDEGERCPGPQAQGRDSHCTSGVTTSGREPNWATHRSVVMGGPSRSRGGAGCWPAPGPPDR